MKPLVTSTSLAKTVSNSFLALLMMLSVFLLSNNVAEAGASIGYKITNISITSGQCVVYGYFYNNGNSGATVTQIKFFGTITNSSNQPLYNFNQTWAGSICTVGWIGAGSRKNWSFTSRKNIYRSQNSGLRWNINTTVSWRG